MEVVKRLNKSKSISILLIAMIVMMISVASFTLAENTATNTDNGANTVSAETNTTTSVSTDNTDTASPKPVTTRMIKRRPTVANTQAKREGLKGTMSDDLASKRARVKEAINTRVKNIRERYLAAKERYLVAKKKFVKERLIVVKSRERFVACKNDDTAECKDVRKQIKTHAKPFLSNSADMVLGALDRVKTNIEGNEAMDEDVKSDLLTRIDEQITKVTEAKATIENLDNESTPDEIRAAAKDIRDAWRSTRVVLKRSVGHSINAKLGNIIHRTEQLSTRIDNIITKLSDRGEDVSALEAKKAEFDAKLGQANDEWQTAVDLYKNAGTPEEIDNIAKEAHQHVVTATGYLKEVRNDLRDIVKEIKGVNRGKIDVENTEGATATSDSDSASANEGTETNEGVETNESTETESDSGSASADESTETNSDSNSNNETTSDNGAVDENEGDAGEGTLGVTGEGSVEVTGEGEDSASINATANTSVEVA